MIIPTMSNYFRLPDLFWDGFTLTSDKFTTPEIFATSELNKGNSVRTTPTVPILTSFIFEKLRLSS